MTTMKWESTMLTLTLWRRDLSKGAREINFLVTSPPNDRRSLIVNGLYLNWTSNGSLAVAITWELAVEGLLIRILSVYER